MYVPQTIESEGLHQSACGGSQTIESEGVLEEALPCSANTSAAQRWEYLRDTIYNAASLTLGNKQAKTVDWFKAHLDEIQDTQ